MKISRIVLVATCLVSVLVSLSACTTWSRRKPLEIAPYAQRLSSAAIEDVSVVFEETLPKRPLNETVWDNRTGPFWDSEESRQIGFTQDYSKFLPVAVSAGVIGGAVGGAVAGLSAGPELVESRIVIPFGNIFTTTFASAIAANSKKYSACCLPDCDAQKTGLSVLKIRINEFYVWEGPLNHINLVVKGKSEYSSNGVGIKEYRFEKSTLSQKLGTVMSTHASFIKEMNRISNVLAQDVSTDVLSNAF